MHVIPSYFFPSLYRQYESIHEGLPILSYFPGISLFDFAFTLLLSIQSELIIDISSEYLTHYYKTWLTVIYLIFENLTTETSYAGKNDRLFTI